MSASVQIGGLVLIGMKVLDRVRDGDRVLDTIGNDPSRFELEDKFLGSSAFAQMQMRIAGKSISFSGGDQIYGQNR